jgi:Holliday junction resolvase RusA-like endonuclease
VRLRFVIPGSVAGKGRPRFTVRPVGTEAIDAQVSEIAAEFADRLKGGEPLGTLAPLAFAAIRKAVDGSFRAIAYTPSDTVKEEEKVRSYAASAMAHRPLIHGPVSLTIVMTLTPPQSWSAKKRAAAEFPMVRPDADNVVKLISDAMQGTVLADDKQVCDLVVRRRYSLEAPEQVEIVVDELAAAAPLFGEVAA